MPTNFLPLGRSLGRKNQVLTSAKVDANSGVARERFNAWPGFILARGTLAVYCGLAALPLLATLMPARAYEKPYDIHTNGALSAATRQTAAFSRSNNAE
jgi:hypothetical protein